MIPIKGLWRDSKVQNTPDGFSPDIRNVIKKDLGTYTNEPGFEILSNHFIENDKDIVSIISVNYGKKLIFSKRADGNSEIGILDNSGLYTTKLIADLGFDKNYPITGEFEYNYKNELIIAFTDNNQTPKIINIDNIPSPFSVDRIELFPITKNPKINTEVLENSGQVKTGTYYPVIKYRNNDYTETYWLSVGNPIYITNSSSNDYSQYEGAPAGLSSTKAIQINVGNIDTNYDKIVLGIIYIKDGEFFPYEVKEMSASGTTVTFVYSGSEEHIDMSLTEVLVTPVFYNKIKHLTQSNGILYGATVTEETPLNLQKYTNLIKLGFTSELIDVTNLTTSFKVHAQNGKKKHFMHQEVYAFYIRYKIKKKGFTEAYLISGRDAGSLPDGLTGTERSTNSSLLSQDSTLANEISVEGTSKYYQTRDTTKNLNSSTKKGDFGFWENENETYPNKPEFDSSDIGGEDLRGKKVRHHRFPSIRKCKAGFYSSESNYGVNKLDLLGIYIKEFPTFPVNIADQIEGYEILYAKRSPSNSTVAGQDLLLVGAARAGDGTTDMKNKTVYTSGGNWRNKLIGSHTSPDKLPAEEIAPNGYFMRFHSFDLLLDKPAINANYVSNQLHLRKNKLIDTGQIMHGEQTYAFIINYADPTNTLCSQLIYKDELTFAIKDFKYVPNNVETGNIKNYRAEEFIHAALVSGNNRLVFSELGMNVGTNRNTSLDFETTYLTSIMVYKKDMYNSFYAQDLASTGKYILLGETVDKIYGGDTFTNSYSFLTFAPRTLRDIPGSVFPYLNPIADDWGVKILRNFICESHNNIGLRHTGTTSESKYYPKESAVYQKAWFVDFSMFTNPNRIEYNSDYSRVNDLNSIVKYDPFVEFVNEHPFRIIRCQEASPESKTISWRTFKANDYFELQKNRGFISNIKGVSDYIYINTEFSIFITIGSTVLKQGDLQVELGTGNIFDRPPRELLIDEHGYAGCQHKFSCLLTAHGYLFIDAEKKKVFIARREEVKELTTGLSIEFEKNMQSNIDNPFLGKGFTSTWDSRNNRVLITQNGINKDFTFSLDLLEGTFIAEHDYIPDFLFNDRLDHYSIKDGIIYKHGIESKRGDFYGTIYPSFIVSVYKAGNNTDFITSTLSWITEVMRDGKIYKDETLSSVTLWNSFQATNDIDIIPFDYSKSIEDNFGIYNARRVRGKWRFNKFRDLVINNDLPFIDRSSPILTNINVDKDFELKKRFIDNFLCVKYLFSNEKIDNLHSTFSFIDFNLNEPVNKR